MTVQGIHHITIVCADAQRTLDFFALEVPHEDQLLAWRERLLGASLRVTDVRDRVCFKSIYLNGPDGHAVELTTSDPGFAVDEDATELGSSLKLPSWLGPERSCIEANLPPLSVSEPLSVGRT